MIAKIVKGRGFGGAVRYILDLKKQTNLLASDGVRLKSIDSIIHNFALQAGMNPKLSKPVCHISLSFSAQDKPMLNNETMTKIALEYMKEMGVENTQFVIARHYDKEHPHCHIIFNRVDNNGKTISDSNDRVRSTRICLELTKRHGLYIASGKENVKLERLKEPDKTKYQIYHILKVIVPRCRSWKELQSALKKEEITVEFKRKGNTDEIQGVRFAKNGYLFNGSKVDRQFSYSKIDYQLQQNAMSVEVRQYQSPSHKQQSSVGSTVTSVIGGVGSVLGGISAATPQSDNEEQIPYHLRRKKRKKKRGISF